MLSDFAGILTHKLLDLVSGAYPNIVVVAAICTALTLFSSQACNPGKVWWRSRDLLIDACYWLTIQIIGPYIRTGLLVAFATVIMCFTSADALNSYIDHGKGPIGAASFWWQVAIYLIVSDFLLYWIHRVFHGERMWGYHAIHHSAEQVDWTTSYRFHPVNLCLGPFLVDAIMLYLGVAPAVLLYLVPFQAMSAMFVHANLNWTFGPLKYVVATPVFHRWHHSPPDQGGDKNFAPTFSLWDALFGTFYMPAGRLPQTYGVDDVQFPRGFLGQLIYPFVTRERTVGGLAQSLSASASAIGSAGPQPRS